MQAEGERVTTARTVRGFTLTMTRVAAVYVPPEEGNERDVKIRDDTRPAWGHAHMCCCKKWDTI